MQEVDKLTVSVVLPQSGQRTEHLEVDLRDENAYKQAGPSGMLQGCLDPSQAAILVTTYTEGHQRPGSTFRSNKISFNVKTPNKDKPVTLSVSSNKHVSDLKKVISEKTNIPENIFYLRNCKGKKLEEQRPFSYYYYGFENQVDVEMIMDVKTERTRSG